MYLFIPYNQKKFNILLIFIIKKRFLHEKLYIRLYYKRKPQRKKCISSKHHRKLGKVERIIEKIIRIN